MHYYQFNLGDYHSHTGHLSDMEDLAYRRLIDWQHLHEKPIPKDINQAARLVRMQDNLTAVEQVLNEFFTLVGNGYENARCMQNIAAFHKTKEKASMAGKASAKARKAQSKQKVKAGNGRSTIVKQPCNQPQTKNQEPKTNVKKLATRPDDVSEQVWNDFLLLRKEKRSPFTVTAFNKLASQAGKANITIEQALEVCCDKGWQSFNAEWNWQGANIANTPGATGTMQAAWKMLTDKIGVVGGNEYPEFADSLVSKALFKAGSWMEVCRMTPKQLEYEFKPKFMDAYKSLAGKI